MPEVASEDSSSKSKNAITRGKSRNVELGRKEFPTYGLLFHNQIREELPTIRTPSIPKRVVCGLVT